MAFISYEKANTFLDGNKLAFANNPDIEPELIRATNLILSRLSEVYPNARVTWVDTLTTPALIQDITGALCAAWRYSKVYSEEQVTSSSFAVALEAKAMELLDGLATGAYVLDDASEAPTVRITSDDFWPNDSVSDDTESEDYSPRRFDMNMEF